MATVPDRAEEIVNFPCNQGSTSPRKLKIQTAYDHTLGNFKNSCIRTDRAGKNERTARKDNSLPLLQKPPRVRKNNPCLGNREMPFHTWMMPGCENL